MAEGKARNFLDRVTGRKLEDLVLANKGAIEKGQWSQRSFAEMATTKFKRPVTEGNVKGAATTMGVQFQGSGPGGTSLVNYRQLRAAIRILAQELVEIKGGLGEVASPVLIALSEQREPNGESNGQPQE